VETSAALYLLTFVSFSDNKDSYLELSDVQTMKLRHLSLVTLAARDRVIPYSLMQKEFAIDNTRALEDLIIEAMYSVRLMFSTITLEFANIQSIPIILL